MTRCYGNREGETEREAVPSVTVGNVKDNRSDNFPICDVRKHDWKDYRTPSDTPRV